MLRRDYDIFEKLPNGSSVCVGRVTGKHDARRKLYELAEQSQHEFVAVDVRTGNL
jgi:hypothetical protein